MFIAGPPGLRSAPSGTAAAAAGLSASPAAVATAAARRRRPLDMFRSMGRSWALINSSSMFRRLALCMAVIGVVSEVRLLLVQGLAMNATTVCVADAAAWACCQLACSGLRAAQC